MPIDAEKLLRFTIPRGMQDLSPRDAAFYALSIGMAQDPLDADDLPFVDPLSGPAVLPSMVLVMAHPGFWLGHPESGVDPLAVLHAAQSFTINGTIPREGVVKSETTVTGLVDKGPGKAALIETRTILTDFSGADFASLQRTTFVRNGGGFGGSDQTASAPIEEAGSVFPDHVFDTRTLPSQALLYRLNGDLNPLHSDPEVAAKAGFSVPILHGLCTMGIVTRAVVRVVANNRLGAASLRFSGAVMPGETVRTEIWNDGRFLARVVERDVIVATNGRFTASSPNFKGPQS